MITPAGVLCVSASICQTNSVDSHDRDKFALIKKTTSEQCLRRTPLRSYRWKMLAILTVSHSLSLLLHILLSLSVLNLVHIPSPSLPQVLSAAGLGSGLTEAIVVNPFEVVKVSLQANRDSFKEVA